VQSSATDGDIDAYGQWLDAPAKVAAHDNDKRIAAFSAGVCGV
jgi:hypothetical protein